MLRHYVVRFKRHDEKSPELRWFSPEPAEHVVIEAENVPMAVRQFYRDMTGDAANITLLEVVEKDSLSPSALQNKDFFRTE